MPCVLRRAETLAHLVIVTGAQMKRSRRQRMALGAKLLGVAAHDVGDPVAGVEPSLVVLGPLSLQQAADVMQRTHVAVPNC